MEAKVTMPDVFAGLGRNRELWRWSRSGCSNQRANYCQEFRKNDKSKIKDWKGKADSKSFGRRSILKTWDHIWLLLRKIPRTLGKFHTELSTSSKLPFSVVSNLNIPQVAFSSINHQLSLKSNWLIHDSFARYQWAGYWNWYNWLSCKPPCRWIFHIKSQS